MITLYLSVLAHKNNYKNVHVAHGECEQPIEKQLLPRQAEAQEGCGPIACLPKFLVFLTRI
jgi:hypothetical protein